MSYFFKVRLYVSLFVFAFITIVLQGTFVCATSVLDPGVALPIPGEMVITSSKDIPGNLWVAEQYLKQGNFNNVIVICQQILNVEKDHIEALANLTAAYKGVGDDEKFNRERMLLEELAPQSATLDFALAQTYLVLKDFVRAEQMYLEAIKKDQREVSAHMGLAVLYEQQGRLDDAIEQYLVVLNTKNIASEHFLYANFSLCQIWLLQRKYDLVVERAGMLTDLFATIPQGHLLLAKAYFGRGDVEQAIRIYAELTTSHPEDPVSYQELALVYSDTLKDYQQALDYAKMAVEKFPDNAKSSDVLGWVYYNHGQYPDAIIRFKKAVSLLDENPFYHYHLGLAYQKKGENFLAENAFRDALHRLDPDHSQKFAQEITNRIDQCH